MFVMIFYLRLLSGLGFIFAGIVFIYGNKTDPNRYKHGTLPAILALFNRSFTTNQRFSVYTTIKLGN
jgi:hypothetical protein